MTKTEIIEYVMHTPYNTNKQILSTMLDELEESLSGGNITNLINKTITSIESESKIVGESVFENCSNLTSVNFAQATEIESYAFNGCISLTNISFPNIIKVGSYAFSETGVQEIDFPKVETLDIYSFYKCNFLEKAILPKIKEIGSSTFAYCPLRELILENNQVCLLSDIGAFANTPISQGNGFIYVPPLLVEDYKASTNWIVFANQIKAIGEEIQ